VTLEKLSIYGMMFGFLVTSTMGCSQNPVIAKVGRYAITKKDFEYRNQITALEYPSRNEDIGLQQLVKSYTLAEILQRNGHAITEQTLDQEEIRIDTHTRDRPMLEKIKAIFKGNRPAYRKVYILPVYAGRTIYFDFFLNDPKIQAPSKVLASELLAEAIKNPSSFDRLTDARDLKYIDLSISESGGIQERRANRSKEIHEPRNDQQQNEETKFWIETVLGGAVPGKMVNRVVDHRENFILVKYISFIKKNKSHQIQVVLIPKTNYQKWLDSQIAAVARSE
jgi:hypothetical protein